MNHIPREIGHEKHRTGPALRWAAGVGPIQGVGVGSPAGSEWGLMGLPWGWHLCQPLHPCPACSWQLAATCNVEPSLFIDWFSGHLNFQIEHQ